MISAIKPFGLTINEQSLKCREELDGKFYAYDKVFNKIEISKEDYLKLKCPIRKRREYEVQGLKDW